MMRRAGLVLVAALVVTSAAEAGPVVAGVAFPDAIQVAGRRLHLNGAGLRTRFLLFKVYAIGLYVEHPTTDAAAILAADEPRCAELHLLRALSGKEIASAIAEAFARNAGRAAPRLADRLARLEAMFPAVEAGEAVVLTYVPGNGTVVEAKRKTLGTIEGKDFADVLFAVWIGAAPVDRALKRALLAGG
ncbi:MAG TPA: chalcone isomerase family protein [Candidatus Binatia bacterium]|nr:chalcone isomerase family protein [Candidatus Binatia bacterium]